MTFSKNQTHLRVVILVLQPASTIKLKMLIYMCCFLHISTIIFEQHGNGSWFGKAARVTFPKTPNPTFEMFSVQQMGSRLSGCFYTAPPRGADQQAAIPSSVGLAAKFSLQAPGLNWEM